MYFRGQDGEEKIKFRLQDESMGRSSGYLGRLRGEKYL